jgi:hypothetical protein
MSMSKLEGFVDRFEGTHAIILKANHTFAQIERCRLPKHTHLGDYIIQSDDALSCQIDYQITEQHRREIRRLMDSLFD